jgi:four helix bundle protein
MVAMPHDISERSFRLALAILTMRDDPWFHEMAVRHILRQLVRAGTSVGSNMSEATAAQTKPDFIAKASIAKKEAFETQFWLRLGLESHLLTGDDIEALRAETRSVGQVISAIVRSAKRGPSRGSGSGDPR